MNSQQLYNYFGDWTKVLDKKILKSTVDKINLLTLQGIKICPDYKDIFKAFTLCTLRDLKIVFLGQDPYPQKNVATGILFGNRKEPISPSLEIIEDACVDNTVFRGMTEFDHTLESWARQGILMINSALTVELGKPTSHSMIWRPFIASLLTNLCKQECGIVYVLFGSQAQTFEPYINTKFNDVIKVPHPAYYARIKKPMPHTLFEDLDRLMTGKYGKPIKWYEQKD